MKWYHCICNFYYTILVHVWQPINRVVSGVELLLNRRAELPGRVIQVDIRHAITHHMVDSGADRGNL